MSEPFGSPTPPIPEPPPPPPQAPPEPPRGWAGYPPPPPPPPRRSRALPIIFGLLLVFGGGVFILVLLGALLIGGSGGSASIGSKPLLGSRSIALLRMEGPIMQGQKYDFWMKTLRAISEDDSIRGVILRLDSPGGSVGASQELYDEILALRKGDSKRKGKLVYASMGDLAASGAYYIAAACDRIFANRGTLTGSIGVISTNYRIEDLAEKAGIKVEVVKSGRFKDAGSMFRPMTPEEQKVFDLMINDAYGQFVADVLSQRERSLSAALKNFGDEEWDQFQFTKPEAADARQFLLQVADGRVYTGSQALKLGLVDELGALNRVASRMAKELGVSGRAALYEPQMRQGFFDMLSSKAQEAIPGASSWSRPSLQYRMLPF